MFIFTAVRREQPRKGCEMNMQEMPYERFMAYGAASLTNAELIAVILRTGTRHQTALELARRVLNLDEKKHPGLLILRHRKLM